MLTVHCLPTPEYSSCAYLVAHDECREAIIIDPGHCDISPLIDAADNLQVSVPFIILTHEHFDHTAGVNAVKQYFGSRLVCSRACAKAILDPKQNLSRYLIQRDVVVGPADILCEDLSGKLDWFGMFLRFIHTPGHSPGSICIGLNNCLFSGDTLLGNKKTPTNLPGGYKIALQQSITRILNEFAPQTTVYPGHGSSFLLREIDPIYVVGLEKGLT
jgi:hydroxyacylglutathione hydrolase